MNNGHIDNMQKAVASGDWPAVLRLWDVYAGGIRTEIGRGTCTPARMAEAREFLEWAKRIALCARAQAQNRLNAIHAARQYSPQRLPPPPLLRTSL
jgi:hypothetical protein